MTNKCLILWTFQWSSFVVISYYSEIYVKKKSEEKKEGKKYIYMSLLKTPRSKVS